MGNAHALEKHQLSNVGSGTSSSVGIKDFESRWRSFMNSLDLSAEHIKQIELLDEGKKAELLSNYVLKKCSAFHYVTLLKATRIEFIWKKKVDGSSFRSLLSSIEISLRTNNVEWVYDFLDLEGLETLVDLMLQCMHFLSGQDTTLGPRILYGCKSSGETYRDRYEMSCNAEVPNFIRNSGVKLNHFSPDNAFLPPSIIHSSCSPKGSLLTTSFLDFLEDCLHLSLRSLKAILNNQRGCRRAMEHALVISLVTFCLLHPNYSTKTLALDMLTALCLIEGGHVKVLQSFDRLRVVMGEGLRFELLLAAFRYHESLDVENYNLDFAVTCVQFLNIIVHSPENINLRVYLQYELHLLGFDDLLKQIRDRSGSRLKVQIEAYLDNRVDCSLLLEDAEAKEAAVLEQERLEKQLESEMIISKKSEENFKLKETELLRVAESLRMKKREFEVAAADRESALYKQINELHRNIQLAQLEISDLRQNLHLLQTCTTKSFTTMSTSTHFENSRGNSSIANNSTNPNSSSDPPTLVTRAMSTEDNFSSLHHCNGNNGKQDNYHPSPSGSETSLNTDTRDINCNKQGSSSVYTDATSSLMYQPKLDVQYNTEKQQEAPVKPQRKITDQKVNNLFPSCTLRNSTTCKQLANQAANYLAELVKLVSSLSATELFSAEHDSSNDHLIMIYPIGWEFAYLPPCPSHRYHDDSVTTQLTTSLDTIFNDQIFRTCYLANISMKAEGICTNSEDFFHIYSNQLPDLWFNAYKKISQNLSNKQQTLTSVNSLHKTDDSVNTKHTNIFDDLHRLGLLETSSNNQSLENIEAVKIICKDKEIKDNFSKSKLTEYLLHLKLNPIIAQRLINEIYYITENLISNNNNSFMIMNSSTIELFDQMENIFQKYFNQFNMDKLFFCITDTNKNQQRWFYLLSLLHGNLIKFTLIEELKLINENISLVLECCTSLLVSTKLPLIIQLVWRCTNMLLNNHKSTGFQLKSLDSLIDWQFTSPRISNTKSQIVQHDQQSSITEIQVNEVKFLKTDFMSMFVKYIMKISPSLLNWTSELNQLDVVSRISISDLFKRIEYVKSNLTFLIHYSKTTEFANSSSNNCTNDNNKDDKMRSQGNLSLENVALISRLFEFLTKTSETVWCILHSTAYWIKRFQPTSLSTSTSNMMLSDDWLNPLVRFASSFKNCVNDLDRKSRHSQNSSLNIHDTQSSSHSHHRHSQKHLKEQDKISSSSKRGNRHRKLRTRQLDTDGLMDDILHNLTLNPLRADIHVKRSDKID
ncbi:unnamed protein product [Schistosoma rodhaini]|uniref:GBD/FH3 domain-containing protein n=1 Tax=Schistosoma rodhaini TaxID=6188 RepID=A0AA85G357_9TREM|nr:unnamed protein product [Schistosoma rodhaini]